MDTFLAGGFKSYILNFSIMMSNSFVQFDYEFLEETHNTTSKTSFISQKGSIPLISDFREKDIFKKTEIYHHTFISKHEYAYRPSYKELEETYQNKNISLDLLKGNKCHTEEAKRIFCEISSSITPTDGQYYNHLVKFSRKATFLGNEIDIIFDKLCFLVVKENPIVHYAFDKQTLYDIVEDSQLKPYQEQKKNLVFNPKYQINPIAQHFLQSISIAEITSKEIEELFKLGLTQNQIIELSDYSNVTVQKHLKKLGLSTKGNKVEQTINAIRNWRKENPKGIQIECSKALKLGERTVQRYWKEFKI
jgi:hypothetical protein